jgi:hypothetical protein
MRREYGTYGKVYLRSWPSPMFSIGKRDYGISRHSLIVSTGPATGIGYASQGQLCFGRKRIGLWWRPAGQAFMNDAVTRALAQPASPD